MRCFSTLFGLSLMRAARLPSADLHIMGKVLKGQYSKDLHALTTLFISKGDEKHIPLYRDVNGNNILHLLLGSFEYYYSVDWKGVLSSVKTLLDLGVCATDENNEDETVLNKILTSAYKCRRVITDRNTANALEYVDALLECALLLVPKYKGLRQKNSRLLHKLNAYWYHKFGSEPLNAYGCMKWIELYQVIVENDVFPVNFIHQQSDSPHWSPWQHFLNGAPKISERNPCSFCKPVTRLLHTAILKGLNVDECDAAVGGRAVWRDFVPSDIWDMGSIFDDNPYTNDCCYLSLLEILIHCRADVRFLKTTLRWKNKNFFFTRIVKMMLNPSVHYSGQPWPTYLSPYSLDLLHRFSAVVLLYYPDLTDRFLRSLSITSRLPEHVPGTRQRLLELKELSKAPRSLKMLSRLCIVDNIANKSRIHELCLPPSLRLYVKIGDYILPQ